MLPQLKRRAMFKALKRLFFSYEKWIIFTTIKEKGKLKKPWVSQQVSGYLTQKSAAGALTLYFRSFYFRVGRKFLVFFRYFCLIYDNIYNFSMTSMR